MYKKFADSEYKPINPDTQLYERWQLRRDKDHKILDTVKRTEKGKVSGFSSPYIKLDEVPPTLCAAGGFVRFDVPGFLSKRDILCIQSFPQDYDFMGRDHNYVCGMSVPPIMMHRISEQIRIQLLDKLK